MQPTRIPEAPKRDDKEAELKSMCRKMDRYCREFSAAAAEYTAAKASFDTLCPKGGADRVVTGVVANRRGSTQTKPIGGADDMINVDHWIKEADDMITEAGKPVPAQPGQPAVPATGLTKKFNDKKAAIKCHLGI